MSNTQTYADKFTRISQQTSFQQLPAKQQSFIKELAYEHRFTLQELRQFIEIAQDLNNWRESDIEGVWSELDRDEITGREGKKHLLRKLTDIWLKLKAEPNIYKTTSHPTTERPSVLSTPKDHVALGACPVASDKTRCCNLLTLDAVESCGFDCSYCSIQSFYHGNRVTFDSNFADNLSRMKLDQDKTYHIGTGQSSDSLMWGNKHNLIDGLVRFAQANPNVILELKTKSTNINYLSKIKIPRNIICTWSLNTQPIIDNEEHHTASLQSRLEAARKIADRGAIVGFHLHPIVHYAGWSNDYSMLYKQIQNMFIPSEVAMVSLGTLTFIKPVIKKIRARNFHSKILKMPLVEAAGKLSYPPDIKLKLFNHAYTSFSKHWREDVFFYLCMEDNALWEPVFGFEYNSNEEFEQSMKSSYLRKIYR